MWFLNRTIFLRGFFLFALFAFLLSCRDDVVLYTDNRPVPVVYCLLDPADSLQFVRVGRSYQAENTLVTEQPAEDSLIWKVQHEVYIEEYADGVKKSTFPFTPNPDIRKDTGFFPASGLQVYSAAFKPIPGREYRLYVYFPDLDLMVFGTTVVHGAPVIRDPLPLSIRTINFEPGQPYVVRWLPGPNTGVYEMIFRVHYRDSSAAVDELHFADYSSGGVFDLKTDQLQEYGMGGPAFLKAMAEQIPVVPGLVREVVSVEFVMISGGIDLAFLYRTLLETGSNFTNFIDYSNLSNGIGIFSSRSTSRVPNLTLSKVTLDELARSETTRMLGFKDSKGK